MGEREGESKKKKESKKIKKIKKIKNLSLSLSLYFFVASVLAIEAASATAMESSGTRAGDEGGSDDWIDRGR